MAKGNTTKCFTWVYMLRVAQNASLVHVRTGFFSRWEKSDYTFKFLQNKSLFNSCYTTVRMPLPWFKSYRFCLYTMILTRNTWTKRATTERSSSQDWRQVFVRTKLLARQDAEVLVQGWQRGADERQFFVWILLMEEILHQLIWRISHFAWGFMYKSWCRISSINSMTDTEINLPHKKTVLFDISFQFLFFVG